MPSKKRRRAAPAADNEPAQAIEAPAVIKTFSLERYHFLPAEIKRHIIDLACLASASSSSNFKQDVPTILSLCLTSRHLYAQATPSLYRHVSITRPSSLYALQQVIQKHPQRAAFIRSLHIGPRGGPLPEHWWPLRWGRCPKGLQIAADRVTEQLCEWITTSLDEDQLPTGYRRLESWPLSARRPSGCREAAIHEALEAACDQLDVDLTSDGQTSWGDIIGAAWVSRVLEVQAALDVYLLKLRSMEDDDPALVRLAQPGARIPAACRTGSCSHYPALVITGLPPPRWGYWRRAPLGAFRVHRGELLRHLARPGATTDRFDHPVTLARSGFGVDVIRPSAFEAETGARTRYEIRSQSWDIDGVHELYDFPDLAMLRPGTGELPSWDPALRPYAGPLSTATLGSTLRLARSVLASLQRVSNLSLTGYLEAAVAHDATGNSSLRRLTLGPSPPCWGARVKVQADVLGSLTELRVCGGMPTARGIESVAAQVKHLRLLEWSMGDQYDVREQASLTSILDNLVNRPASRSAHVGASLFRRPQHQHPTSEAEQAAYPYDAADGSKDAPLMRARLDDVDVTFLLRTAPSQEIKEAWMSGIRLPNAPSRLLLITKPARSWSYAPPLEDSTSEVWAELHDEGRAWWRGEEHES